MLRNIIIGQPLDHTLSPDLHNQLYVKLCLNEEFVFEKMTIEPENLYSCMEMFRREQTLNGLAVTIPHKVNILKYLDIIDQKAQQIGAVNTVIKKNGKLIGYNTDWIGIYEPLKQTMKISDSRSPNIRVAILGGGGAARSVIFACNGLGYKSTVFLRNTNKGSVLQSDFGCQICTWGDVELAQYQVIINTTPIGMYPNTDQNPLKSYMPNRRQTLFDLVYNPDITQFLQSGIHAECTTIKGSEMFIYQAQKQFELFTDVQPDIRVVRQVFGCI